MLVKVALAVRRSTHRALTSLVFCKAGQGCAAVRIAVPMFVELHHPRNQTFELSSMNKSMNVVKQISCRLSSTKRVGLRNGDRMLKSNILKSFGMALYHVVCNMELTGL